MLRVRFWEKVHYSAVFEGGKNTENALSAEIAETWRTDLRGTRDRRRPRGVFNWEGEFVVSPLFA
jgi:hypothetical protein